MSESHQQNEKQSEIPLYGYIDVPDVVGNQKVLYFLKETNPFPNIYYYKGRIGYGCLTRDGNDFEAKGDYIQHNDNEVSYNEFDMSKIKFFYNKETNRVVLNSYYRRTVYAREKQAIKNNVETDYNKKEYLEQELEQLEYDMAHQRDYPVDEYESTKEYIKYELDIINSGKEDDSYPYIRFPRSKDGISISRALNNIFKDREITIFLPKELLN